MSLQGKEAMEYELEQAKREYEDIGSDLDRARTRLLEVESLLAQEEIEDLKAELNEYKAAHDLATPVQKVAIQTVMDIHKISFEKLMEISGAEPAPIEQLLYVDAVKMIMWGNDLKIVHEKENSKRGEVSEVQKLALEVICYELEMSYDDLWYMTIGDFKPIPIEDLSRVEALFLLAAANKIEKRREAMNNLPPFNTEGLSEADKIKREKAYVYAL